MPFTASKYRRHLFNPLHVLAGGIVICLFLTIRFHHALDIDTPPSSSSPPLSNERHHPHHAAKHPQHPKHASINHRGAAAAATTKTKTQTATTTSDEEGVSACLLVNDENPRLPEWLAYHYLTLPLRTLIVAVDPASRSSPNQILYDWYTEIGLDARPWGEKHYLPAKMRGPCPYIYNDNPEKQAEKCLWHHRNRQQYFIMKCMEEFKNLNKTWVLLTDVDEYIVFNQIRADDPPLPLEEAPEGTLTMSDWRFHKKDVGFVATQSGILSGILDGTVDGKFTSSNLIFAKLNDTIGHGSVLEDIGHQRYFLRDDIKFHEADALHGAPPGIPTIKETWFLKTALYGKIFNDTYDHHEDGKFVPIEMNWEMGDEKMRSFYGGHLITDAKGRQYYVENEHDLWPPHYLAKDSMVARARLPSVSEGGTILDVLKREAKENYTHGELGPCITMPRLRYGSREDGHNSTRDSMAPDGFSDNDFVTLRYRWHAPKGEFEASKFGKTIIDVSRVPESALQGMALNIHRPLVYFCRKDPPQYSASLFRVNHYLDSFEAYSYRNDVRSKLRQCKECYDEKGKGAAVAVNDDVRPWLQKFVEKVGHEKAQRLLSNAGHFVKLE
ncbi:hypothetical protein ACHAXR_008228 [Thalassiosira sp. AJA248-18]